MQEFDHVHPKAFISGKIHLIAWLSGRIIRITTFRGKVALNDFNNRLNEKVDILY